MSLFNISEDMVSRFYSIYNGDDRSLQMALLSLKESGCSQMQCLILVKKELSLSIAEADDIVLNSKAWASQKEENVEFRKNFKEVIEKPSIDDES